MKLIKLSPKMMKSETKKGESPNKKTILIVEDETALLRALSDKFTREGFTVLKAGDGMEGLTLAIRKHPDLILLDVILPKCDGIETLKALRADEWGKNAEVILLTNLDESDKIAAAMSFGAREYLVKSEWRIEDVVKKVKERLGMGSAA